MDNGNTISKTLPEPNENVFAMNGNVKTIDSPHSLAMERSEMHIDEVPSASQKGGSGEMMCDTSMSACDEVHLDRGILMKVNIEEEIPSASQKGESGEMMCHTNNANEYVATLSWASFREIFRSQYFPLSEKEKYEREYHTIAMTDKETSTEFMKRFVRLAGFLGAKAGTQAEPANKFKWALRQDLLNGVVNLKFDDIAGVANAIRNIETADERVKHGVKRILDTRRSDRQGYERSGYDGRRYDRQDDRRERSGRDRQQRGQQEYRNTGGRGDGDVCKTCGKSHPGRQCHRVSGACFNCSQTGHIARDCPKPAGYNQGTGRVRALAGQQYDDTAGTVSDTPQLFDRIFLMILIQALRDLRFSFILVRASSDV
ncbi:zinc finger, CCHC-type, Retrotransposon gag domain protein [Artemisia annua]|uniref:Zinc finger, CCHC-type, Retrotransposon gag domain protein n=1 Tax=Artemisia annua TaxID=35608 RepID=A0A2U1KDY5_ARTAN|nr:zinc finger, CCHC-type, Retrotransposon gag domain protein [Artemisia annua]